MSWQLVSPMMPQRGDVRRIAVAVPAAADRAPRRQRSRRDGQLRM